MKKLLTALCFLSCTSSSAQKIEILGKYGASFIGGETIEFTAKDSFYFNGFYCTYGVYGKGRCEIRNNYLYLNFEKSKDKTKRDYTKSPIITKIADADSLAVINITGVDNNAVPISYGTIQLGRRNKATIGTMTDSSGKASFTIRREDIPLTLETSSVGFESRQITIDSYSSYNITLFHSKNDLVDKELNNGEVFVYEIEDLSEDLILMRPENSRERFRQYRKKN